MTWTERLGPSVKPPSGNEGFGDILIRATVSGQLGGEISQDWRPEGLLNRVSLPRSRLKG
jgi:two-component sensor histidine kinase